jgi:hypothetical protein
MDGFTKENLKITVPLGYLVSAFFLNNIELERREFDTGV